MRAFLESLPYWTIPFVYGVCVGILIVGIIWVLANDRDRR